MGRFRGAVAAITGASSGIGRALALQLACQQCALALSDVNEVGLAETVELVEALGTGVKVTKKCVDVAQRDEVHSWAEEVAQEHGKVNAIINNAGVTLVDTVEKASYEDIEWIVNINFWGVVHGTKAFLPYLKREDIAHIVNISSIFGIISVPTQAFYNATKFAVRGFTEALSMELAGSPIVVSSVHPGGIKTSISRNARHYTHEGQGVPKEKLVKEFEERLARLTPDQAAQIIIQGMQRKKRRILVGSDARLIQFIQRLFPVKYQSFVDAQYRRRNQRHKS